MTTSKLLSQEELQQHENDLLDAEFDGYCASIDGHSCPFTDVTDPLYEAWHVGYNNAFMTGKIY